MPFAQVRLPATSLARNAVQTFVSKQSLSPSPTSCDIFGQKRCHTFNRLPLMTTRLLTLDRNRPRRGGVLGQLAKERECWNGKQAAAGRGSSARSECRKPKRTRTRACSVRSGNCERRKRATATFERHLCGQSRAGPSTPSGQLPCAGFQMINIYPVAPPKPRRPKERATSNKTHASLRQIKTVYIRIRAARLEGHARPILPKHLHGSPRC